MRRFAYPFALFPVTAIALLGTGCQQAQSAGQMMGGGLMSVINPNAAAANQTPTPVPAADYAAAQPAAPAPAAQQVTPVSAVTPVPADPVATPSAVAPASPMSALQQMMAGAARRPGTPPAAQAAMTNAPALAASGAPAPCPASRKGKREDLASGEYRAYCPNFNSVICKQQTEVWCWAAGIEMVYKYDGKDMAQETIVERVHKRAPGDDPNSSVPVRAALEQEVMIAMCPDDYSRVFGHPVETIAGGEIKKAMSGQVGKMSIKFDYMSMIKGTKDLWAFDATDMVQSISSGSPVLLSLRHKSDPTIAHMYTVYSVTYKPTLDVAGSVINGAMAGKASNAMASGPRPGYILSEIEAIDPWTAKSQKFEISDIQPRVAYMLSEPCVKRAFGEMSNSVKVH